MSAATELDVFTCPLHGTRLIELCKDMLERHGSYVREHFEDMPEVRDWTWTEDG